MMKEIDCPCVCGICLGELDFKIVKNFLPDSSPKKYIRDLNFDLKNAILRETIRSLIKIRKVELTDGGIGLIRSPDPFFNNKGYFIRRLVILLDDHLGREVLHKLLGKSLARAYLVRMERHFNRVNSRLIR